MCIMEVRPGQRSETIVQACAHNANTIIGDLQMFEKLASARSETEVLRVINEASHHITHAYAVLLSSFGEMLAKDCQDSNGHWTNPQPHDHPHGNERTFSKEVDAATKLAHTYETR